MIEILIYTIGIVCAGFGFYIHYQNDKINSEVYEVWNTQY